MFSLLFFSQFRKSIKMAQICVIMLFKPMNHLRYNYLLFIQLMVFGQPGLLGSHVVKLAGKVQQHDKGNVLIHRHKMEESYALETIQTQSNVFLWHVLV